MNNNIDVDSQNLNFYISQLKECNNKMNTLFENIKINSSKLPDYWESKTCDSTMADFEKYYKEFDVIKESNERYINFLENIVIVDYVNKDETLNSIIDSNI